MKNFFYKLIRKTPSLILKNSEGLPRTISLRNGAGFTLLEMIVAVSILVGAIMGPIAVAVSGINAATSAKNRILANYLAMEAMEVLKNRQYTNFINGVPFQQGILLFGSGFILDYCNIIGNDDGCKVDVWGSYNSTDGYVSGCDRGLFGPNTCNLYVNPTSGDGIKYGHQTTSGWAVAPNNLTRYFQVEQIPATGTPEQLLIIVNVEWTEKGVPKSVVLEDYLQNWGNP